MAPSSSFKNLRPMFIHICSVEGHVIAVEAEGDATESCVADEGNVLRMADTSELLSFNTKYVAGGPYTAL